MCRGPLGSCSGEVGLPPTALKPLSTSQDPNVLWLYLSQVRRVALQAVTCPAEVAGVEQRAIPPDHTPAFAGAHLHSLTGQWVNVLSPAQSRFSENVLLVLKGG